MQRAPDHERERRRGAPARRSGSRSELETGADVHQWSATRADRPDDLLGIDALQIDARRGHIRMLELPLNDRQRHALPRELDSMRIAKLVRREPTAHTGLERVPAQLPSHSGRGPRPPAPRTKRFDFCDSYRWLSGRWSTRGSSCSSTGSRSASEEQTRRIESRIDDPRKVWKLSPMDLKSYSRWYEYSRARDEMFAATDTEFAPWHIADSNVKKRARLNIISHLLERIPYDSPPREPVVLPAREKRNGYREPDHSQLYIPAKY